MVGSFKQSLLVLSSIAVALGGCTYNEDELHAGNPSPRDASVAEVPSGPDLLELVDLPGPADLPGAEDLPAVSVAPDAEMPVDDAETADVLEGSDVADGADDARPDAIRADANTDASLPERDTSVSPGADSATDQPAKTDASVDSADGPATGRDARDAGVGDSAADLQQGETRGLDSQGLAG
jgi:hypothetical protein